MIRRWWRKRQKHKRRARWFGDVIRGQHTHSEGDEFCGGGFLVPPCVQSEILSVMLRERSAGVHDELKSR